MSILENGARYTVYDAMEASGMFRSNPANANSRDKEGRSLYSGPVKFPMMLYHPMGKERVLSPGTVERMPDGSVAKFNEQWEIITRVVEDEESLKASLSSGWHRHPAMAIRVANETWRKEQGLDPLPVPPMSAASRIDELEEANARLMKELEEAKATRAKDEEAKGTPEEPSEEDPGVYVPGSDSKFSSQVSGSAHRNGLV